jgi:hypothetical protein
MPNLESMKTADGSATPPSAADTELELYMAMSLAIKSGVELPYVSREVIKSMAEDKAIQVKQIGISLLNFFFF